MANVTLKKYNKQIINNYRPISLLPIFAKVFEKINILEIILLLMINPDLDLVVLSQTS